MINESSKPLYRGSQIVWYILLVIESLLAIRFVLKLLQANPEAMFTNIVYTFSGIFTLPFVAVFNNMSMSTSVFEWTTLLAMLVYWLLAVAIIKLFIISKPISAIEANQRLSE